MKSCQSMNHNMKAMARAGPLKVNSMQAVNIVILLLLDLILRIKRYPSIAPQETP